MLYLSMKKLALLFVFVNSLIFAQGEQRYADGTANDQDGNTFEWINYGTQDWAIENAEVVTYRDGTPIPQAISGPSIDIPALNNDLGGTLSDWGLVGDATVNGWDGPDMKMYETSANVFELYASLLGNHLRFRFNEDWTGNYGDDEADGTLDVAGEIIAVPGDGVYHVVLNLNSLTYSLTEVLSWSNLTTGAWCYYDNDPTKPRLYNWYAVMGIHDTDPNTPNKEFAPEGWHVPTDAEWTTLENYLIANGYNYDGTTTGNKIGKAMVSTTGWNSSTAAGAIGNNQSTNNSSGFNAFPEGFRNEVSPATFNSEGSTAKFWSSTEVSTDDAWSRYLYTSYSFLGRYDYGKRHGFSVRFVRDATSCLVAINPDTENQSVCEGNLITPIEYSFSNDISGINLTWTKDGASIIGNPPGIGYSINTGQLVFEGNPSENITTTTTYSYNIQTTGGLCGSVNANGTIVVHPIPRIQLAASTVGSLSQIKCEGDVIDDIVLNLLDGASSPVVIGLPAGVSAFYDPVANTLTISGTLDAGNPNDNYNYTVTASGSSGGCTASLSGALTISREDVLTPMSEISQSVCEGNQITPISFNYSGGAIGVTLQWSVNGSVINLPSGLVVDNQEGNLTISGTLENFNSGDEISYSVTTNNSGCTPAKSYSGIITIVPTEQCIEPGKIILNGPVEVNDGTFYIKKEDGLILYSSFDDQCYRIKVHTGQVIAEPINCD